MGEFTPKVTIELSEYERLKDIEYQALDLLKSMVRVETKTLDFFVDPEQRLIKYGTISKKDLEKYFDNLFGLDKLIIIEGE